MDEDFARMMMVLEMKSKDKTNNNEPVALVLQMPKGKGEKKKKKKRRRNHAFPHELHNLRYHCLLACYAVFSYILPIPEKKT